MRDLVAHGSAVLDGRLEDMLHVLPSNKPRPARVIPLHHYAPLTAV